MEIKDVVNSYGIIGVIGSYKSTLDMDKKISELGVNNLVNALKMVELSKIDINTKLTDLSTSELLKVDLATKLHEDIIIIGSIYNSLIFKEREVMKKLLLKLHNDYNKKIVVIDNHVEVFFNLAKKILVLDDKEVIYETSDFYDSNLYKWVNTPRIIEFINYINKDKKILNNNTDIYELIKDIYRGVS